MPFLNQFAFIGTSMCIFVKGALSLFLGEKVAQGKLFKNKSAQAVTEYVFLLACIAIICMAGSKIFHLALVQCYENFIFIMLIPIP
jgi:hypothetical protein